MDLYVYMFGLVFIVSQSLTLHLQECPECEKDLTDYAEYYVYEDEEQNFGENTNFPPSSSEEIYSYENLFDNRGVKGDPSRKSNEKPEFWKEKSASKINEPGVDVSRINYSENGEKEKTKARDVNEISELEEVTKESLVAIIEKNTEPKNEITKEKTALETDLSKDILNIIEDNFKENNFNCTEDEAIEEFERNCRAAGTCPTPISTIWPIYTDNVVPYMTGLVQNAHVNDHYASTNIDVVPFKQFIPVKGKFTIVGTFNDCHWNMPMPTVAQDVVSTMPENINFGKVQEDVRFQDILNVPIKGTVPATGKCTITAKFDDCGFKIY